jgi:glycosyltransferase involved in cell wall biosynthesis
MKILLCHGYYTQRGGEDRSFEEERELLAANGHEVVEYVRQNDDMNSMGKLRAAWTTVWNRRAATDIADIVRRERPAVVHFTNTFPLISPAAVRAARRGGAAVVQALRNYRLLCASPYLLRDGRPCEDCLTRTLPLPAVIHRCYRDSTAASAAVAAMQVTHRLLGTWRRHVDAFFTLTEFARQKFLAAGFPAERVHVKHNSVHPDPGVGRGAGDYFAFAARLSAEKGVRELLAAWALDPALPTLKIIGDGPLAADVAAAAKADPRIEPLGHLPEREVHRVFGDALAVIVPSLWYETFGRTAAEAFAVGTPVIASQLGALAEIVDHRRTGWLAVPGDSAALAAAARTVAGLPADDHADFRRRARAEYEARFTPQRNYDRLLEIYAAAIERRSATSAAKAPVAATPAAQPASARPLAASAP